MNRLLCLIVMLCAVFNGLGQSHEDFRQMPNPFYIDSWINRDIPLGKIINYKDSIIKLCDFNDKIIILDFWFTHCTDCIAQFPKEDSLQKQFAKDIQFLLITFDSAKQVKDFFSKWQAQSGIKLPFPTIVEDTTLRKLFRHIYDPHYAWIFPNGYIVGQTSEHFVTADNINGMLKEWAKRKVFFEQLYKERAQENAATKQPISNRKINRQ